MAISRVPGFSLLANLDRQGTDVFISSNGQTLFYWDVNNYKIGIKTDTPQQELHVSGNILAGNGHVYTGANTAFDIGTPGNNWGNLYIRSVIGRDVTASGNISAQFFSGNGSQLTGITSSYGNSQVGSFLQNYTGVITAGNVTVNGNVTAQYLLGDGSQLSGMYSNVQVATFLPTYTGVVTAGNITINGNLTAQYLFGNGSQILGLPATYSNIQVATFLPTYSGVITAGNIYVSGPIISGNITISDTTIASNSRITVSTATSANIILSTSGTGAVQFTGNNAIGLPVGNIANRPTRVNVGYLRFNTEFETIEVWDGYEWVQTSGGVITSDVLSGDGSTATFALSANTTTTGVLVSINGTIQKPSTAYTVSNNSITFTETPLTGDSIEVRKLSGGTISVNYGNADVAAFLTTYPGLYSNVQALSYLTSGVAGNIIPSANVTYSLGSPTRQWKDLFVSNNTIYIGGIPLTIDASGNLSVNGSQVQGSGGSGGTNYSNTNVAAYTTTQGYTNYSNVNVAAYLSTNNYLTSTTANLSNYAYAANITTANVGIIGYIDRANTIQSNQISAANVGIIGYIDLANTIQSTQISAANLGMRGYVDNQITTIIGSAPGVLDTLGELANALGADANLSVTITSQIANVNANITTANLGMKGYVDNSVSTANIGVIGYIDRANTIQSNQITAANLGIKGYIDNSTSTANIGMKGYVDSVATLSSYSNVNVSALITTNGLTNYSNVNVVAYLAGNITVGNITTAGSILAVPEWVSAGNITLTATTTNPTKGTTTSDNISYRQLGAKQWEVVMTYVQTATNGTAGTGDYLITLPNSLSFDTTLPSQQITTTNIGTNTYALMTYIIPSGSGLINQGSVGGQVYPLVYNATKFRILTTSWNSAIQCWGSGYYSTIDVPKIQLTFRFTST